MSDVRDVAVWMQKMDGYFTQDSVELVQEILDLTLAVAAKEGKEPRDLLKQLAADPGLWNDTALALCLRRVAELRGET